ncbi:MAG TPA: hypothetical protein VHN80_24580 [Kineosporiaceae bacterium]|nr:hypothetical protein [Kineosporiaceae bacterium]
MAAIAGRATFTVGSGQHDPNEPEEDGSGDRRGGLSVELRRLTRVDHERTEQLLDLPGCLSGPADLAALLHGWQRIWREIKQGCAGSRAVAGAKGWPGETAALARLAEESLARIAVDLAELIQPADLDEPDESDEPDEPGGPDGGPVDNVFVPMLADEPGVWGTAYVLRGSAMGGRVLAPLITAQLDLAPGVATSYHAGADDAGRSWVGFRHRLDSWGVAAGPEQRRVVVRRARSTFAAVGGRMARPQRPGAAT